MSGTHTKFGDDKKREANAEVTIHKGSIIDWIDKAMPNPTDPKETREMMLDKNIDAAIRNKGGLVEKIVVMYQQYKMLVAANLEKKSEQLTEKDYRDFANKFDSDPKLKQAKYLLCMLKELYKDQSLEREAANYSWAVVPGVDLIQQSFAAVGEPSEIYKSHMHPPLEDFRGNQLRAIEKSMADVEARKKLAEEKLPANQKDARAYSLLLEKYIDAIVKTQPKPNKIGLFGLSNPFTSNKHLTMLQDLQKEIKKNINPNDNNWIESYNKIINSLIGVWQAKIILDNKGDNKAYLNTLNTKPSDHGFYRTIGFILKSAKDWNKASGIPNARLATVDVDSLITSGVGVKINEPALAQQLSNDAATIKSFLEGGKPGIHSLSKAAE